MKSAIYKTYGSPEVIQIIEVEKPLPKSNEVLVKIKASSASIAETLMRQGKPKFGRLFLGLFKPKNNGLGTGFSGIVESTGSDATKFNIGDKIFGEQLFGYGSNSEYLCISEDSVIAFKPDTISHQEAAPICDGFLTSYSFLKDIGSLKKGQHILVNGASGSLGSAAVQIAKQMGAKVTGVSSTVNIDLVKSLGADYVIDYKKNDFTEMEDIYDIIYDAVGKSSYIKSKKALGANGIFMTPVLSCEILWYSIMSPKKVKFSATGMRKHEDLKHLLNELVSLFKQKKLNTIIDRTYQLKDIIEAHKYLESGRKIGNIAIINQ